MIKVFDFVCNECGSKFERFLKETSKVECPLCGTTNTTKQVASPTGFQFKGVGFEHRTK